MKVTDILKAKEFTVSIELLTPKSFDAESLQKSVEAYGHYNLDFYSMTLSAGGKRERKGTISLAHRVKDWSGKDCIVHLSCLDSSREDIEEKVADIYHLGLENILALRGDLPDAARQQGIRPVLLRHNYRYATDLIAHLSQLGAFCIGGAAYPCGYSDDLDVDNAIHRLKQKQDAGAEFAITQMVFDASAYFRFVGQCRETGVTIPIIPETRMLSSYGACVDIEDKPFCVKVPVQFKQSLQKLPDDSPVGYKLGLEFTLKLCHDLKEGGAPGVHLCCLGSGKYSLELIKQLKR